MSLWDAAYNTLDMGSASLASMRIFEVLSRGDVVTMQPKLALALVRAIVVAMVEGYQGKIRGRKIMSALAVVQNALTLNNGIPTEDMITDFRQGLDAQR